MKTDWFILEEYGNELLTYVNNESNEMGHEAIFYSSILSIFATPFTSLQKV